MTVLITQVNYMAAKTINLIIVNIQKLTTVKYGFTDENGT